MKMSVRIAHKRVFVGDESRALLSGELHFWRLPPSAWPSVLRQIADLGLRIISTYVCWEHHQITPEAYDFTGRTDPSRNLVGFLDLVRAQGLWLILRPGPYIYAEWVNNGVPDRVGHLHRLHPDFLAAAQAYLMALLATIKPYLASNGGPIVMLQADNEPDPWVDFYARQLGLADETGVFQEYLAQAYAGDLDQLNACWLTHLSDFRQARAVMTPTIQQPGYLNRYLDYRRFIYWYSEQIVRWTTELYRAHGVDVPVLVNHYPHHLTQDWRALESHADISGIDYYSHNEFTRDSWEHAEFLHLLRYLRVYAALPFISEFQAGIWHGWHTITGVLTPRHYQLAAISALLAGVAGWNWYMLVNRDNWYMSPINEWGRDRPELLSIFQRLVALFHAVDPPSLTKLTQTAVALDILDRSSEIGGFDDPLRTACYEADLDYECFDLATGAIAKPLLLYSSHRWLSAEAQQRLRDYVETGGHLVFFDQLPVQDERLRPCNLLNLRELREPDGILGSVSAAIEFRGHIYAITAPHLFRYETVPGEPLIAQRRVDTYPSREQRLHFTLPHGLHYQVGYHERRGAGTITVLGLPPSAELVRSIHAWFNVPFYSRARLPGVSTALYQRDRSPSLYLMVVNNRHDPIETSVELWEGSLQAQRYHVHDLWADAAWEIDLRAGNLRLALSGKSGTVLRLDPV